MNTMRVVLVALSGLMAFALPARADTTLKSEDATVELTVPNGWRQTKVLAPSIAIQATDGKALVMVWVVPKEDYKDLKAFAQLGSAKLLEKFVDVEPKFEDLQVNGKPAMRVMAEGMQSNGIRRGFVMTFLDTDGMFINVAGVANASAFKTEQQILEDMAGRVKILSAAAAPQPPAAAAPATPPAAPPATPPARQPPPGRQPR